MRVFGRRRDPYWGLDGRAARRVRARRRIAGVVVVMLSAVLLALILARRPEVDARTVIAGWQRSVLLASLVAEVLALFPRVRARTAAAIPLLIRRPRAAKAEQGLVRRCV